MGGLKAAGAQNMGGNMAFMTPALHIMKMTSHWEKSLLCDDPATLS